MSMYTPPPYNLLPIKKQCLSPTSQDNHYNPSPVMGHLLALAKTAQTEVTESTFTEWRNQLTTNLDTLVAYAHLIQPSDLISLLQDGIAAPLEHELLKALHTDQTSLCFLGRCQRIADLASGLAEYLRKELGEGKKRAHEARTSAWEESCSESDGVLALVGVWFSISAGSPRWSGRGEPEAVGVHPALTVTVSMLAAAIGFLSVRDERNAFTHTMKEVNVSAWQEYSTYDDEYLGLFWSRLVPGKEERETCKCSQCRSYLVMLVSWRLTSVFN